MDVLFEYVMSNWFPMKSRWWSSTRLGKWSNLTPVFFLGGSAPGYTQVIWGQQSRHFGWSNLSENLGFAWRIGTTISIKTPVIFEISWIPLYEHLYYFHVWNFMDSMLVASDLAILINQWILRIEVGMPRASHHQSFTEVHAIVGICNGQKQVPGQQDPPTTWRVSKFLTFFLLVLFKYEACYAEATIISRCFLKQHLDH